MLTSPDVTMTTDSPLWMSSIDDVLPNVCFDQVKTFMAAVAEAEVAVHVRVKLFDGGMSITIS